MDVISNIPQLSPEENAILTDPFIEKEVWEAISQMEHNKSLALYGFPAEFYKRFGDTLRGT